jgi:DNA-binding transcriptional MocR family regulator
MITACGILWQNDILITPATFPAVPVNRNLVRFSLTSANTEEELDQAIRALQAVWNALHPGEGAAQSREVAAVLSS